jgi:hypothetical protein
MDAKRVANECFLQCGFINILLLIIFAPTNIFYLFYFGKLAACKQPGAI